MILTDNLPHLTLRQRNNPQADTSEWEGEIDRLVYLLYNLVEDEVRIVENHKVYQR